MGGCIPRAFFRVYYLLAHILDVSFYLLVKIKHFHIYKWCVFFLFDFCWFFSYLGNKGNKIDFTALLRIVFHFQRFIGPQDFINVMSLCSLYLTFPITPYNSDEKYKRSSVFSLFFSQYLHKYRINSSVPNSFIFQLMCFSICRF